MTTGPKAGAGSGPETAVTPEEALLRILQMLHASGDTEKTE